MSSCQSYEMQALEEKKSSEKFNAPSKDKAQLKLKPCTQQQ